MPVRGYSNTQGRSPYRSTPALFIRLALPKLAPHQDFPTPLTTEYICYIHIVVILVPTPSFPFPFPHTLGRAPGFSL